MKNACKRALIRRRRALEAAADAGAWPVALATAAIIRMDFDPRLVDWRWLSALAALTATAQVAIGASVGLYTGAWRYGSFDEVAGLARVAAATTVAAVAANIFLPLSHALPRSVPFTAGAVGLVIMASVRYAWRLAWERRRRPSDGTERLLVFGAGEGAAQVITSMLRTPDSPYLPVALLDDSPRRRNLRIQGVPVVGTRHDLRAAADRYGARVVLIAIPSASRELIATLIDRAAEAGLEVKVLPPVRELFGSVSLADIRELQPEDLLGRREIETDLASIAGYVTGKRVLVTGAGGSIGSELSRQIAQYGPAELMLLDRDESALHAVQLSIEGRALLDSDSLLLADIRDGKRLDTIFREKRPEVVFHAAALKHLTLLERNPGEALQTNVWGTLNVLIAAAAGGVERFVNISTDKAADPTCVLGYSKRVAERLTAYFARKSDGTFLSVRFGNVLGSRGSMMTSFQAQIRAGGPLTVTHPEVTRYFMTIQEACQLVIQAGAIGRDAEALVLDMGDPVRIDDVARRLASQAERHVSIVYTGLRPGEKLHEALIGTGEVDDRPFHSLISQVGVPDLEPSMVLELDPISEPDDLTADLRDLCTSESDVAFEGQPLAHR